MFERSKRGERALLIQPRRHGVEFDAAAAEFRELARSAGAEVVAELVARIDKPHPALYVGSVLAFMPTYGLQVFIALLAPDAANWAAMAILFMPYVDA